MIEVSKAKEGLYILDFSKCGPGSNAIKFDGVHGELSWSYDHSEVFNLRDVELALLEL